MSDFSEAKSCLKRALRLLEDSQGEMEHTQQKLRAGEVHSGGYGWNTYTHTHTRTHTVRKILHISVEVEGVSVERVGEKMHLYDKLGDLCCSVKAYQAATKFYSQQVRASLAPQVL